MSRARRFLAAIPLCLVAVSIAMPIAVPAARAGTVQVAVASNFAPALEALARAFSGRTGHELRVSPGATGKLLAQLRRGAPFEVFLAADEESAAQLVREGLAAAESRQPYAIGRLALWSPRAGLVEEGGEVLRKGAFRHLSIANPELAPYGKAAEQTLANLKLREALERKLVRGENVAQAFQFVRSGAAELGFVAYSQILGEKGSHWLVPASLHSALRQDAVLLQKGARNPAAREFLGFLLSAEARRLIAERGYELPPVKAPSP